MLNEARSFEARVMRIELLVDSIERSADAQARDTCREIVSTLLELHRAGLATIVSLLTKTKCSDQNVLDACLQDDLVRSLLLLHELHPESIGRRVGQALEKVRPYLQSHGGDVELLELLPDLVRLRMTGSCDGCPSSAATLRDTIERAICEFAPDVGTIDVEGIANSPARTDLVDLQLPHNSRSEAPYPSSGIPNRLNGNSHIIHQPTATET